MVFPAVMSGCESSTIKKAECGGIDAFELWCCRRLLRLPWTTKRPSQSIRKEINPEYKGTFHAKMGSIKDRNGVDLKEAEDIKKRWQEYTEDPHKKDLHDPDHHDGVITHLEPDILECEVKWALGSITMNKASGGDGILIELFQILKDDAVKVLQSICQQIWKI